MKYRKDFVTNSSSSSFVCEICGREESGFDLSLSDAEMAECVNEHVFCLYEMLELPDKEQLISYIVENKWNLERWDESIGDTKDYTLEELESFSADELFEKFCSDEGIYEVPEWVCPICQFIEYSEIDLAKYLEKEYKISRDEVFAKVKQLNKRRRKLYDSEYITEVCQRFNLNPTEIVASWKERFGSYKMFNNYIYGS